MNMLNEQRIHRAAEIAYTSAAMQTMGNCPTWDARMTGYLGCRALMAADNEFGSLAEIEYNRDLQSIILEQQHGQWWRKNTEAVAIIAPYDDAYEVAEAAHTELFAKPLWQASIDLATTPAPTLRAALFKVELVRQEQLNNDNTMPCDAMAVVAEDFAQLGARADDPVARYHRALDNFSAGQIGEADYTAAVDALDEWAPTTPTDLLRKFMAVFSDGATPNNDRLARCMEQARPIFEPATGQLRTT